MAPPPRALLSGSYRDSCYWWEGVEFPPTPPGDLPQNVDVAVIGGGYTGIGAALELARMRVRAVVLEARRPGWGASSRNGGMVLPDVKHGASELRRRHGPAGPALQAATVEAVRQFERLVEDEGIDCGYSRSGHLYLAHCASRVSSLRATERVYHEDMGLEATLLGRRELADEVGSDAYPAGLLVPFSGGVHPARFFAGLLRAALSAGAEVHGETPALRIERAGRAFRVVTARGVVRAREVLVATNGYTGAAAPGLRRRIVPVGSFIIATEPIGSDLARSVSPRDRMLFDTKHFLYYWRLSPDGTRVLFGGRASLAPTTVARARDHLYRGMIRVHPQLRGVRVDHAWGGMVGLTVDRTPRLGRLDGVTYALGYSGTGVAEATWFGRLAGRWLGGGDPPPFAGLRFPAVPAHALLPVALPLVGLWYKLQDRCRDPRGERPR